MTFKANKNKLINRKNMTIKYVSLIEDWKKEKIHPLSCGCILCIWRKYEMQTDRKRGRPYDMLTFFIWDMIFDAKEANLLETGKAKIIKKNGKTFLKYSMIDHIEAPYIRCVKQVLKALPEFGQYSSYYLERLSEDYFSEYVRLKRYKNSNLLNLLSKLSSEIDLEYTKNQPDPPLEKQEEWKRNWGDFKLASKIAAYIKEQPDMEINRRALQRHFNIKIDDLIRIGAGHLWNYGIEIRREGYRNKTVIYYSTTNKAGGKYWSMGSSQ